MTDTSEQTLTLSVEEAAGLLGISRGLAYELVRRGELAAIRLGRRILVPRHVIESLVNGPGKPPDAAGSRCAAMGNPLTFAAMRIGPFGRSDHRSPIKPIVGEATPPRHHTPRPGVSSNPSPAGQLSPVVAT